MGIETLFEGQELSEEFKTKVSAVFEAAVVEAVAEKAAELQEQIKTLEEQAAQKEAELQEQLTKTSEGLIEQANEYGKAIAEEYEGKIVEASAKYEEYVTQYMAETVVQKVDAYLDYVAEQWMEENRLAVESGLKTQVSESFMEGLQKLFAEHYIEVPEGKQDIAEEMAERIAEMEQRLNATIEENIEMRKFIREAAKQEVVDSICEGLADTQIERLNTIAEGIEFKDIDQFRQKLEIVRDTMMVESVARPTINKESQKQAVLQESAGEMGSLIAELTRLASKK